MGLLELYCDHKRVHTGPYQFTMHAPPQNPCPALWVLTRFQAQQALQWKDYKKRYVHPHIQVEAGKIRCEDLETSQLFRALYEGNRTFKEIITCLKELAGDDERTLQCIASMERQLRQPLLCIPDYDQTAPRGKRWMVALYDERTKREIRRGQQGSTLLNLICREEEEKGTHLVIVPGVTLIREKYSGWYANPLTKETITLKYTPLFKGLQTGESTLYLHNEHAEQQLRRLIGF